MVNTEALRVMSAFFTPDSNKKFNAIVSWQPLRQNPAKNTENPWEGKLKSLYPD